MTVQRAERTTTGPLLWSALSVVYIVWGSTYLAIAFLVDSMPPLLSLGSRFVVAAGILALLIRWRQGRDDAALLPQPPGTRAPGWALSGTPGD